MNTKTKLKVLTPAIGTVLVTILAIIFIDVLVFAGGWVAGWFLKIVFGNLVVNTLNILCDTTRFTTDIIPPMIGVLSVVGHLFSQQSNILKAGANYDK